MKRPKHILHVIETSGPGGAETVFLNISRHLDRDRFKVFAILLREGWFFNQLNKYGIDTRIVMSERSWDFRLIWRLMRTCSELNIDLIHSHLPGANVYCSVVGAMARIPVVVTYHSEVDLIGNEQRFASLKHWLVRNLADRIVTVADYQRDEYIQKAAFPASKIATIYNGVESRDTVDPAVLPDIRKSLGIDAGMVVVGNVANLRPAKGHHFLIQAALRVCQSRHNVIFLQVGQGEQQQFAEMERLVRQYQLENRFIMAGFRTDVYELLQLMDIFVLSSISEGLPVAIAEAMAAHKPVVATSVGGLPEVVKDGYNGYLVPPADANLLADRILTLVDDGEKRGHLADNAKKVADEKLSLTAMIEAYQKLYCELIRC